MTIATSAPPARTTRSGSSARRMLSSAAIRIPGNRRRTSTSSGTEAHGCSAYSSGASVVRAVRAVTASSTLHPPLASTRTCGTCSRTARTRARSCARSCPRSATFTFAVRAPGNLASTPNLLRIDGGDRRVDGDGVAEGRRIVVPRRFECGAEPFGRFDVGVLRERTELPPPGRTFDEDDLTLGDTPEPHPHRQRDDDCAGQHLVERGIRPPFSITVGPAAIRSSEPHSRRAPCRPGHAARRCRTPFARRCCPRAPR